MEEFLRYNWHKKHTEERSYAQRIADRTAKFVGSWTFITLQTAIVIVWFILNVVAWIEHWDPYPFILMTLLLSLQAAYAAPIIMMSQNRQNERDRAQAQADYDTNIAAKAEIEMLHQRLERIEKEKLDRIVEMIEKK